MEFLVKKRKILTTAVANKHRFAVKIWQRSHKRIYLTRKFYEQWRSLRTHGRSAVILIWRRFWCHWNSVADRDMFVDYFRPSGQNAKVRGLFVLGLCVIGGRSGYGKVKKNNDILRWIQQIHIWLYQLGHARTSKRSCLHPILFQK